MAKSKTTKQARFMAVCSRGGGDGRTKCPPKAVADRFNKADTGSKLLSKATKEINRTPRNNRFAPGLRSAKGK